MSCPIPLGQPGHAHDCEHNKRGKGLPLHVTSEGEQLAALAARLAAVRVASGQSEFDSATEAGYVAERIAERDAARAQVEVACLLAKKAREERDMVVTEWSKLHGEVVWLRPLQGVSLELNEAKAALKAWLPNMNNEEHGLFTERREAALSEAAARNRVLREALEANAAAHDREPGSTPPCACVSCNRARAALSAPAVVDPRVEALVEALEQFVEYERKRYPPRMGGDEFPPSLRPLVETARDALAAWGRR